MLPWRLIITWPFTMLPILLIQSYTKYVHVPDPEPRMHSTGYTNPSAQSMPMPCNAMQDKWDAMKSPHEHDQIMNMNMITSPKPNEDS